MTTQPEALRLAQVAPYLEGGERGQWIVSAAAELRRLHEVNQELLGLVKRANSCTGSHTVMWQSEARAAIAKAESTPT